MWCMLILYYTLKSECFQSAHEGKSETPGVLKLKIFFLSSREPVVVYVCLNVVYANIILYSESECF